MSNQAKNNDLNYLIDQIFTKVNRLFCVVIYNKWRWKQKR